MLTRLAIISAAAFATAAAAAPEPPKPAGDRSPQADRKVTILASVDKVGAQRQPVEAPKKPRAMRVTTCRCGDQIVEPAEDPKDR